MEQNEQAFIDSNQDFTTAQFELPASSTGRQSQALYNSKPLICPQQNHYKPDNIQIETMDRAGRQSFRSIMDSGTNKWKRKSDLSTPDKHLMAKNRISIKAVNQQHEIILISNNQGPPDNNNQGDPFEQSINSVKQEDNAMIFGRASQRLQLGKTTEQRLSRISQLIMKNRASANMIIKETGNNKDDFSRDSEASSQGFELADMCEYAPPDDEEYLRKMSIRSININHHTLHMKQPVTSSILSRASHQLLMTQNARVINYQSATTEERPSMLFDEQTNVSDDEEEATGSQSKHRCSMIKRYNMPTFFATQTSDSKRVLQTPSKPVNYRPGISNNDTETTKIVKDKQKEPPHTEQRSYKRELQFDEEQKNALVSSSFNVQDILASNLQLPQINNNKSEAVSGSEEITVLNLGMQKQESSNNMSSSNASDKIAVAPATANFGLDSQASEVAVQQHPQKTEISQQVGETIASFALQVEGDIENESQLLVLQQEAGAKQIAEERKSTEQQVYSFVEYNLERLSNIVEGIRPSEKKEECEEIKDSLIDQSTLYQSCRDLDAQLVAESSENQENNRLDSLVTKVQEIEQPGSLQTTAELHKQHFLQTLQALETISRTFQPPPSVDKLAQSLGGLVMLPEPDREEQKKVAIFDMDETLIHCVDDIERENPDVVLEIDFSPDGLGNNPNDIVCAGVNIRPYVIECLEEANKNFQVVVFTASHQTYADAILDYLDPDHNLIQFRMYRQHCYLTPEGYYVKDLRVIGNRPLSQMVLIDNSVYSFAYQLTNGVPIVPFYREPPRDEEMLHLIYYLSCLAQVDDVRTQNKQAFELHKLAGQEENTEDMSSSYSNVESNTNNDNQSARPLNTEERVAYQSIQEVSDEEDDDSNPYQQQ